jgi:hypothetical protein
LLGRDDGLISRLLQRRVVTHRGKKEGSGEAGGEWTFFRAGIGKGVTSPFFTEETVIASSSHLPLPSSLLGDKK